ncbi:cytochrome P450 [Sandaracinus amylolyticus]|uniref:Cytochrome P450 n=1 Tax=Sandaracinus amylolyticus TaxID=927083 RepID=A0A0F6SG02_9BACT|nr:cytochrome P450 [Sandaracinus amylolyticus]AKF07839.1 cytochrome P450 [Sandaracinus amylolyticus]
MDARPYESMPTLPGGLPLLGHWPEIIHDVFGFLERAAERADVVRVRFVHERAVITHDPAMIQHVLQQSPRLYAKSRNYAGMKKVVGEGLLTSEGDFWKRQRKLAQPAFHHAKLRGITRTMASATEDMLARWRTWEDGRPFDLHEEMMRVTLRIAGLSLFGADLDGESREIGAALGVILPWVNGIIQEPFRPPLWIPTRENRALREALATLDRLVYRIVEERRRSDPEHQRDDLLSMLMAATDDEGGGGMSDRQLRDEILTAVLAGHETTANALAWTGMLLARHPEIGARVEREASAVLGDRTPSVDDLSKLELCDRVVSESMRLYPPAWEFEREALVDDVAAGWRIPKGTVVMIAPWTLHRSPRFWDEPARFDPDRFLPERSAGRPRYAYLPFGDGPRVCIGKAFAMMESKLLLAMMAREVRFELEPGAHVRPEPSVTLRARGGVPMRFRRTAPAPFVDQTTSA